MKARTGQVAVWAVVVTELVLLAATAALMQPVAPWWVHLGLGLAAFVIWWLDSGVGASKAGTVAMAVGLTFAGLGLVWDWGTGSAWPYLRTFKTPLKVTAADRAAMGYTVLAAPAALALLMAIGFSVELQGREMRTARAFSGLFAREKVTRGPHRKELGDLEICDDLETGKPVIIKSVDRYMHVLVCGPTGSGKTAGSLHKMVAQDLANPDVSVTIVEPKGDWVGGPASFRGGAYDLALKLGRKAYLIDPSDPNTAYFNPLVGDPDIVAEINRTALETLFGDQEAFFRTVASTVIKNVIKLCKYVSGDNVTYDDIMLCLRDDDELKARMERLRAQMGRVEKTDPRYALLEWFRREYLAGDGRKAGQQSAVKQHSLGLRVQLEEMMANQFFRRCVMPTSPQAQAVNLEEHLSEGNVLCVSTNDGLLGNLSKVLGILITTHLQYAIQRRQIAAADFPKVPPAAIYMDEFGGYVTTEFGSFLTKARGFKTSCVLALQSPGQLIQVAKNAAAGAAFRDTVLGQCRTKIVYGGLEVYDAKYFEQLFGTVQTKRVTRSESQHQGGVSSSVGSGISETEVETAMFSFNDIRFQPANHVIYELLRDRTPQRARRGVTRVLDVDKLLRQAGHAQKKRALASEARTGMEQQGEAKVADAPPLPPSAPVCQAEIAAGQVVTVEPQVAAPEGTVADAPAGPGLPSEETVGEEILVEMSDSAATEMTEAAAEATRSKERQEAAERRRKPVRWADIQITDATRVVSAGMTVMPGAPTITFNKTSPGGR